MTFYDKFLIILRMKKSVDDIFMDAKQMMGHQF